jgi:hypothetical protein
MSEPSEQEINIFKEQSNLMCNELYRAIKNPKKYGSMTYISAMKYTTNHVYRYYRELAQTVKFSKGRNFYDPSYDFPFDSPCDDEEYGQDPSMINSFYRSSPKQKFDKIRCCAGDIQLLVDKLKSKLKKVGINTSELDKQDSSEE